MSPLPTEPVINFLADVLSSEPVALMNAVFEPIALAVDSI